MKLKNIVIFVLFIVFARANSQKIELRIGDIKVIQKEYSYNEKKYKNKIGKSEYYFDTSGNILERISYGRHHYTRLNIIGEIEQFSYENDNLVLSKSYRSSCKSCDFFQLYTKYIYNNNRLKEENTYYSENDSLFMAVNYVYNDSIKETHFNNNSTFYQKIYDSENRIIEFNQIFEDINEIRWQWKYKYADSCRTGNFQTYYGDGKENSKKEIEYFDSQGRIITEEIIDSYKTKLIYTYSKNGIIKEIKEYQSFGNEERYELYYVAKFTTKGKVKKLNLEVVNKINEELIE